MPPAVLVPRPAASQSDASSTGGVVQDFTSLPTLRPEAPHPENIHRYNFGVEAQTIPLPALQRDGKAKPERFIGRQKDTEHETIYYLSGADYDRVYRAYHKTASTESGGLSVVNDSFYAHDRHVSIIRLPDRPHGKSVLGADGGVYLSREEKRYLDGLAAREHTRARGHSEYQAYYNFHRRVDPNIPGISDSPALTPQEINNKVAAHIFELRRTEKISEQEFERVMHEMRHIVGEDSFLSSLLYVANRVMTDTEKDRVESLMFSEHEPITLQSTPKGPSLKAAERRRQASTDDRVEQATKVGFDRFPLETQADRISPLLERESVRKEIADNSPIPLLHSPLSLDLRARGYAHISAVEKNRKFTLVDGTAIAGRLEVRYHSRTQEIDPELPGYRVTLEYAGKSYELADVPVIRTGAIHPPGDVNYVVLRKKGPAMYWNGRPLRGDHAPDMLVTQDGKVFTRQEFRLTKQNKRVGVVANEKGEEIHWKDSHRLKGRWHIPFIPTAMDIVGRDSGNKK